MPQVETSVFISYRRSTSWAYARLVYEHLTRRGYDVFMDVESIDAGSWERVIFSQIAARAHFIPILTAGSVERCANADDIMRREIERAIDLERNVVPLLFQGFSFEDAAPFLTGKLALLAQYNGVNLVPDYFVEAMNRLRARFLSQPLQAILHPVPAEDRAEVEAAAAGSATAPRPTPDQLEAERHFEHGMMLAGQSDYPRAIQAFTQAIAVKPDFIPAYYQRGRAYANEGLADPSAMAKALADWQAAVRLAPHDRQASIILSCIHREQGNLEQAIAAADEGVRRSPADYEAYLQRANALRRQARLAEAVADYDAALRLNPRDATAYNNRGLALYDQGDYQRAMADYDAAIRLSPRFAPAYYNRGLLRQDQDDQAGALADYNQAIRLNPRYAVAYNNRGNIRFAQGDHAGALADYDQALRLDPGLAIAAANRYRARQQLPPHHS